VDDSWNAPPPDYQRPLPAVIALCPVLGNPAHYDAWSSYPDLHPGVTVIEDACESLGARTADGRLCGTFGHLSTLSFFYSHQISAIELGAILTDDPELNRLCRLLRNHGNSGWGQDDFDRLYNFELFGFNVRPTEMHCAIARAQLQKLPTFIESRRENQRYFRAQTANLLAVTFPRDTSPYPSPFGIAFRLETPSQRARLVPALRAAGIDCRPPTGGSFTRHPYGTPWRESCPTPAADLIHDTGLFIGNPPWPAPDLIDRAIRVLRETL
jgi:CDP-6-deoxy-D-xylo-4-hexulose-3-dehydrase